MTTLEILKAGRARIADPKHWTQRVLARDAKGFLCMPEDPDAVRFCSLGAIERASGSEWDRPAALPAVLRLDPNNNVGQLNDESTHAEVLAMWDRAIAAEEAAANG